MESMKEYPRCSKCIHKSCIVSDEELWNSLEQTNNLTEKELESLQ